MPRCVAELVSDWLRYWLSMWRIAVNGIDPDGWFYDPEEGEDDEPTDVAP